MLNFDRNENVSFAPGKFYSEDAEPSVSTESSIKCHEQLFSIQKEKKSPILPTKIKQRKLRKTRNQIEKKVVSPPVIMK